MDVDKLPKGPGSGEMADLAGRKPMNEPGVYEHPQSGNRVIVMPDPKSTAQQDALIRLGFTKVAEPPTPVELAKMQADQLKEDEKAEKRGDVAVPHQIAPTPDQVIYNGTTTDLEADLAAALARANEAEAKLAARNTPSPVEEEVVAQEAADAQAVVDAETETDTSKQTKTKEQGK